jgi:tetratricopeptide (TPR) repeat protein
MRPSREVILFLVVLVITGFWAFSALSGGPDSAYLQVQIRTSDRYEVPDGIPPSVTEGSILLKLADGVRTPYLPPSDIILPPPITLPLPRLIGLPITMPPPSPSPGFDQLAGLRRMLAVVTGEHDLEAAPDEGDAEGDAEEELVVDTEKSTDVPEEEWPNVYDKLTYRSGDERWGEIQEGKVKRKWGKYGVLDDRESFYWIEKTPRNGRNVGAGDVVRENIVNIEFANTVANFYGLRRRKVPEKEPGRYDLLLKLGADLKDGEWRTEDDAQAALAHAVECLREALLVRADDVEAVMVLSECLRIHGDWDENLALLEDVASRTTDGRIMAALGEVYEAFDLMDQAEAAYRKGLAAMVTDTGLLRRLAALRFALGDVDEAAKLYDELCRFGAVDADRVAGHLGMGLVALKRGDLDAALKAAETAEQGLPEPSPETLALRAAIFYLKGDRVQAAELAKAAMAIAPLDGAPARTLGLALALDDSYGEAKDALNSSMAADPFHYSDACMGLGLVAHLEGLYEDSVELYERAAAAAPRDPYLHYILGVSYNRDGRLDEAQERLMTALRLAPEFVDVLRHLGLVHQGRGEWTASVKYLARAVELEPDDADLRYVLASSLLRDESLAKKVRLERARAHITRMLELRMDDPLALNVLGYVIYSLDPDQGVDARAKFDRVERLRPKLEDPDGTYARTCGQMIRDHDSKVIWRDLFEGRELRERWITFPAGWVLCRPTNGFLEFEVRKQQEGKDALFFQYLKQTERGELVEMTAEVIVPEGEDVNFGLTIAKRRKAGGSRSNSGVTGELTVGRDFQGKMVMRRIDPRHKEGKWMPILLDPKDPESVRDWPSTPGQPVRVTIQRTGDRRRGLFDVYINDDLVIDDLDISTLGNRGDLLSVGFTGRGGTMGRSWKVKVKSFEMSLSLQSR